MIRLILTLFCVLNMALVYGQDPQFSQFYMSRLNMNPAFAGNTEQSRFMANYRYQWGGIPGGFTTYSASYDHNFFNANSGMALQVFEDVAGSGGLKHTRISGMYSYLMRVTRKLGVRMGVQGTYAQPSIDYSSLIFNDQIQRGGDVLSVESFRLTERNYADFSAGAVVFSERYWAGFSAHHINTPSNSFYGNESNLPVKYSVHGGINIPTVKASRTDVLQSITFAAQYKAQAKFDQLDFGAYYHLKPLLAGIWYRGLPFKTYEQGYNNADALVFVIGVKDAEHGLQFGYSYDLTISQLVNETAGSHEVAIGYEFHSPKPRRKRTRSRLLVPCAHF